MAVRLFVGNLAYSTTEADLRSYFGAVAPPSQVVLPVDRETGRPRGFAFVEFIDRAHAEQAIQRFNGQPYNGRPLAVTVVPADRDRAVIRPGRDRPAAGSRLVLAASRRVRRSIRAAPRRAVPRHAAATSVPMPNRSAAETRRARRRARTNLAGRFR